MQIVAILGLAAGIFVAGAWSDRTSPRRVLVAGCLASVVLAAALAPMLGSGSLPIVGLYLTLALFTMGFVYGPLGIFLPSLFPARVRYTGASLAFNLGGILGGGLAPFAAQALADRGGLNYVGAYLAAAALISLGWPSGDAWCTVAWSVAGPRLTRLSTEARAQSDLAVVAFGL